jgi:hypothetical protein
LALLWCEAGGSHIPLLFNAAVDVLAEILEKAKISGHISGVVGHLIPGGGVAHLICFETMSGLKINFDKSEVMVMGYSLRINNG